jgi:Uma2 family endonuclease
VNCSSGECLERVDAVFEVVSPGKLSRDRDYKRKRTEYAQAGIPEYWIVDPHAECVTVLKLSGDAYVEHGVFKKGDSASSVLLKGFGIDVGALLQIA